ncbi:MAG: hypothetical protein CMI10_09055 [Oceanospirillaceae bacterium]|nr:hypothetical protein [Oceanospirillaceae bacterium]
MKLRRTDTGYRRQQAMQYKKLSPTAIFSTELSFGILDYPQSSALFMPGAIITEGSRPNKREGPPLTSTFFLWPSNSTRTV